MNETVRFSDKPCTMFTAVVFIVMGLSVSSVAVPIENWRFTWYKLAAQFELTEASVSRMFWDEIGAVDTAIQSQQMQKKYFRAGNNWFVEPAISVGFSTDAQSQKTFFDGQLFHQVAFKNIQARQLLHVDTRYNDDPEYPAHPDRSLRGRIEEAVLQASWKNGYIRVGRQNRNWGPFPDRSLLLSSYPYTYDAIELQLYARQFEFRHLFAPFSSHRTVLDSDNGSLYNRYLTAHSLIMHFTRWVTFGITETVLFTRQGSIPDLVYVNPVSLYSVINTNQEGNGNLQLGFQWNIHPGTEDISLRGQLLFDDFQVDNEIETDKEPTHWGIDAGIFWRNPLPVSFQHLVKLECTYASEWLYTVPDYNAESGERYVVGRRSLGLPFNNGMYWKGGVSAFVKDKLAGEVALSLLKKGGNTPLTSWQDSQHFPGLPVSYNRSVEKRVAAEATILYSLRDVMHITAGADIGWIKNRGNLHSARYSFDPAFSLECAIHYPKQLFQFK